MPSSANFRIFCWSLITRGQALCEVQRKSVLETNPERLMCSGTGALHNVPDTLCSWHLVYAKMLILCSCADFLSLFTPCEDPTAFTAGDGAVGDSDDLTNIRDVHRLQRPPLGIADVVVGIASSSSLQYTISAGAAPGPPALS